MSDYTLISADSHINEPPDTFVERVPESFRARAPRVEKTPEGDVWTFETGAPRPIGLDSMAGRDYKDYQRTGHTYQDMRRGAYDATARVEDMDVDGVDAEVIYPGAGFRLTSVPDLDLKLVCMQAYNDWLAEFCSNRSKRLIGLGLVPVEDVDKATQELRRVAKLGLKGAVLPAIPKTFYSDPGYEKLWATAAELRLPLSFHIGGMRGMNLQDATNSGKDGIPDPGVMLSYMSMSKLALAEPLAFLIFSGVLERHPDLKMVLVEGGFGWLGYFVTAMDTTYGRHRFWTKCTLKEPASYYFHRQVRATFIEDLAGMEVLSIVGAENVMWSSDYPHSDSTWPNSKTNVEKQFAGVSPDDKRKIIAGNVAELYNLN